MKKRIVGIFVICLAFFPSFLSATNISDYVIFGADSYWCNSTDVVLELPEEFNFQGNFSLLSPVSGRVLSYSLGIGKDLNYKTISINGFYSGVYSQGYVSNSGEVSFACRPFAHLTTFVDIQFEAGYNYTVHKELRRDKILPCHSIRLGSGISVLQSTNLAFSYTDFFYEPFFFDESLFENIENEAVNQNYKFSGVLGIISKFPKSAFDISLSHLLFSSLNTQVSYSRIGYAFDTLFVNSIVLGADYYILQNINLGIAHNLMFSPNSDVSNYTSVNVAVNF